MKLCQDCNTEKPETEFYRDSTRPDGLNWRCKPCHKAHVARINMLPPRNPPPEGMKRCQRCKETKPLEEFHSDKGQYDGKQRVCKACQYIRLKEWTGKNPDYSARKHRERRLLHIERYRDYDRKKKYGLNRGEYAEMLAAQDGKCALCGTANQGPRAFDVDHCHETNRIRGLLCGKCNTGLGQFNHDVSTLELAISYLKSNT